MTSGVSKIVVCVVVCVCCSANCSSPLMWEDQMSLLLMCGALTCSHHKQQSHHQSKEQVHLHVASESCVMWQLLSLGKLTLCEVGDLRR